MRIDVVTLFPEMVAHAAAFGVTGRAQERGLWRLAVWNPRDYATDNHRTVDDRPYEIWTYDMKGKELVPRFGANELPSGLKFVFVDEHGYGEYTLRYSSTSAAH